MRECPERAARRRSNHSRLTNALVTQSDEYDSLSDSDNLIYHRVFVNGSEIECIVDCGSELSLTDLDLTKRLGIKLERHAGKPIKAVNSSPVEVAGQVSVEVVLKHKGHERKIEIKLAVIKDFDFNLLLGNDFNRAANIIIDCKNNAIVWTANQDKQTNAEAMDHELNTQNRVHLLHDTIIKPNRAMLVKVRPSFKKQKLDFTCIVKTNPNLFKKNKIYLKEAEVDFKRGEACVPLINCKGERVKLSCGTIIGNFQFKEPIYKADGSSFENSTADLSSDESSDANFDDNAWIQPMEEQTDGQTMFYHRKEYLKRNFADLLTCDWDENLCHYCNSFVNHKDKCKYQNKWFWSDAYRKRKNREYKEYDHLRKDYLRRLANKRHVVVNFVRKNKRSNRTETVISKTQSNENRDTIKIGDTYVNVERSLSSENKDKLEELILEFKDIFALDDKTLGKCTVDEHAIDLIDPNQTPIKRMPYKYSPALRAEINRLV